MENYFLHCCNRLPCDVIDYHCHWTVYINLKCDFRIENLLSFLQNKSCDLWTFWQVIWELKHYHLHSFICGRLHSKFRQNLSLTLWHILGNLFCIFVDSFCCICISIHSKVRKVVSASFFLNLFCNLGSLWKCKDLLEKSH